MLLGLRGVTPHSMACLVSVNLGFSIKRIHAYNVIIQQYVTVGLVKYDSKQY